MTDTPNLGMPSIAASQAQKHVTHNEALRVLDAAVQLAVLDATRTAPPSSPADGQRHLVAPSPTGAWVGKTKCVAIWQDGAWAFLTPKAGWRAWSVADNALLVFDGTVWRTISASDTMARLGINTATSSTNLLNVKSNAALFAAINAADAGSGDMRVQLSKENAARTASLVFSDAFSGRAEFGLTGDDDFHVKVSADGSTWFDAIRVARASGKVSFPATGGPRELLTANRAFYVRTDGNDSNSGLVNTSAGAFLSVQKAVDAAAALDLGIYKVTIQIADGTYAGAVVLKNVVGFSSAGACVIQGNAASPANVVISATSDAFDANGLSTIWDIKDLKIVTSSAGSCIAARSGAVVRYGNINFGACVSAHLFSDAGARLVCLSNYTISGSAGYHWITINGASAIETTGFTITLTGTPAFNTFAYVGGLALLNCYGNTYSGAATGPRYNVLSNAVIFTNGGGASYLPGNSGGTATNGGLYI